MMSMTVIEAKLPPSSPTQKVKGKMNRQSTVVTAATAATGSSLDGYTPLNSRNLSSFTLSIAAHHVKGGGVMTTHEIPEESTEEFWLRKPSNASSVNLMGYYNQKKHEHETPKGGYTVLGKKSLAKEGIKEKIAHLRRGCSMVSRECSELYPLSSPKGIVEAVKEQEGTIINQVEKKINHSSSPN